MGAEFPEKKDLDRGGEQAQEKGLRGKFQDQIPGTGFRQLGHVPPLISFASTAKPFRRMSSVRQLGHQVFSPSSPGMLPV